MITQPKKQGSKISRGWWGNIERKGEVNNLWGLHKIGGVRHFLPTMTIKKIISTPAMRNMAKITSLIVLTPKKQDCDEKILIFQVQFSPWR